MRWILRSCWLSLMGLSIAFIFQACVSKPGKIVSALEALPVDHTLSVPISKVFGLMPESYACILEPYRDAIDQHFLFAEEINSFLVKSQLRSNEGNWTFIYGTKGAWQLEQVSRRKFDVIAPPQNLTPSVDIHICAYATSINVMKLSENRVIFTYKGAK